MVATLRVGVPLAICGQDDRSRQQIIGIAAGREQPLIFLADPVTGEIAHAR
jgi:hypothetical protein